MFLFGDVVVWEVVRFLGGDGVDDVVLGIFYDRDDDDDRNMTIGEFVYLARI